MPPKGKARAPRPQATAPDERAERQQEQRKWAEVVVDGTDLRFKWNLNQLSVATRAKVARVTGLTPEQVAYSTGAVTVLTYADIWWMVRLDAGEDITRDGVHAEWDRDYRSVVLADIHDEDCDPPEAFAQPA